MARSSATSVSSLIKQSLSTPSFAFLHKFFATWLKLDLTTLAAALTIYGTLSGALKDAQGIAWKIYWYFTRFFTASISVASYDRLNREILNWMSAQILDRQDTRILTASTESTRTDAWTSREKTTRNDYNHEKRIPICYLPSFGTTWFIRERHIFLVRRISAHTMYARNTDEYNDVPKGDEPLVVIVLGRSVAPIKRFFEVCRTFADKQREAFITVRASKSHYGRESWDTTILRPIRPLATVHFDEGVKKDLVDDIKNYLDGNTRRFYTERGIPYRRGYLLHGPPGTGKTSLSLALAGHFGLELYLCHLPSISEDNELERLFSSLPPRCIVLLEDIDAIGTKRKGHFDDNPDPEAGDDDGKGNESDDSTNSVHRSRCTLSGILNVLDGVSSQEGRIVLMTSNMAHKLDKALVRPGRIDKMIFLGMISAKSAELMFLRMYAPDENLEEKSAAHSEAELHELAVRFSECIPESVFTPAQLQGFLLNRRGSAVDAAREIAKWAEDEKRLLDLAKKRSKDAVARRKKKKQQKIFEKLAKSMDKDEQEIDDELEKLEKDVEKGKKKGGKKGEASGGEQGSKVDDGVEGEEKDDDDGGMVGNGDEKAQDAKDETEVGEKVVDISGLTSEKIEKTT